MQWRDRAKTLSIGQKRKVEHCGTEPSAYISNNARGVSLHCFRCGETLFHPHGRMSASELLALRKRDSAEVERGYPDTVVLDHASVPTDARLWVLRAGIRPEQASADFGFGWSDRVNRVIVPILHNGEPTGQWTGRAIDGRKPKYIMPRGSVGAQWYRLQRDRAEIVLVEDILSAIKVSLAGYDSLAILGTSSQSTGLSHIADRKVIVWLDPDAAGAKGYVKLRKALAPYGTEVLRLQTDRDPKYHGRNEIREFIGEL